MCPFSVEDSKQSNTQIIKWFAYYPRLVCRGVCHSSLIAGAEADKSKNMFKSWDWGQYHGKTEALTHETDALKPVNKLPWWALTGAKTEWERVSLLM